MSLHVNVTQLLPGIPVRSNGADGVANRTTVASTQSDVPAPSDGSWPIQSHLWGQLSKVALNLDQGTRHHPCKAITSFQVTSDPVQ